MTEEWTLSTSKIESGTNLNFLHGTIQDSSTNSEPQNYATQVILLRTSKEGDMEFIKKEGIPTGYAYYTWVKTTSAKRGSSEDFEVTNDQEEALEDYVKGLSSQTSFYSSTGEEADILKDIFAPTFKKKVLFSQKIKAKTFSLPRWKPKITIDSRDLESDDD